MTRARPGVRYSSTYPNLGGRPRHSIGRDSRLDPTKEGRVLAGLVRAGKLTVRDAQELIAIDAGEYIDLVELLGCRGSAFAALRLRCRILAAFLRALRRGRRKKGADPWPRRDRAS